MPRQIRRIVAPIAAILLIATCAFAAREITDGTSEFYGGKDGYPVLHDEFGPDGDKDVYVENCGGSSIYVRVTFREAINLTSHTWRPASYASPEWVTHGWPPDEPFRDYFQWTMGGQKWYMPHTGAGHIADDYRVYIGAETGVRLTSPAAIITATAFLALPEAERAAFVGWICDADGFAYWAAPLEPLQATGLLLSHVERSYAIADQSYYYAIDVRMEAVDYADIPMLRDGAESNDGAVPAGTYSAATDPDGRAVIDYCWYGKAAGS